MGIVDKVRAKLIKKKEIGFEENTGQSEPPEKPRPTELSDASVRKIASALQSNSDKISSVKLDDTSINKIGSAIAEKLNKKD